MPDHGVMKLDGMELAAPASLLDAVRARLEAWNRSRFAERMERRDHALWSDRPVDGIENRLGWLELPETMLPRAAELRGFAEEARSQGMTRVILLGMGGSSLAPEVFQRTLGNARGFPSLSIFDTTHPSAVLDLEAGIAPGRTLYVVSSKSGTTIETLSGFRRLWDLETRRGSGAPGRSFIAITDPGTPLETLARERGFRAVFHAPPDVGGRYSALTVFGLVPAALIGVDAGALLERAREMRRACGADVEAARNPALVLGAALGEACLAGRDKLTFAVSPSLAALPGWIEQLVAESTGKTGRGIVPVASEPLSAPERYDDDRFFVHLALRGEEGPEEQALAALRAAGHPVMRIEAERRLDLGAEFYRWEMATAAAGSALGVHPFDQPDVELAKKLAREAMERGAARGEDEEAAVPAADGQPLAEAVGGLLDSARPGDYLCVQAYLAPSPEIDARIEDLRAALRERLQRAVSTGWGPRFLHSTGQLHKGGPNTGLFIQIVDEPREAVPIPETPYTFNALIRAQALGDARALRERGRRLLRVDAGPGAAAGLEKLARAVRAWGGARRAPSGGRGREDRAR